MLKRLGVKGSPPKKEEDDAALNEAALAVEDDLDALKLSSSVHADVERAVATNAEGKLVAGLTVAEAEAGAAEDAQQHCWRNTNADFFRVRTGPNYSKTGRKDPSGPALYTMIAMDVYESASKLDRLARRVVLPTPEVRTTNPFVPSIFIVNAQMPLEAPSVFKPDLDGPTLHAVFYFAITPETVAALALLTPGGSGAGVPASVRLLERFCMEAEGSEAMRSRFKSMGFGTNLEELRVPGFITPYNGKPVLITKSGLLTRHGANGDCLEMDVNVRHWCFPARKGLHVLVPRFRAMTMSIAFVIEGRDDDSSLPEQVLGCVALSRLHPGRAALVSQET